MKKVLLLLFGLLSVFGQVNAKTVLVLGDSLSAAYGIDIEQGWVNLLRNRLLADEWNYQVINASISGETTQGGLTRLPTMLKQHSPDVLIIELGGNDGLRGINLQQTAANLSKMIDLGQRSGCRVLLLGMRLPPNFGRAFTEKFEQLYHRLAGQYSVPLVPFFLQGVAERQQWMQADGIHPTAAGQLQMLDNVWPDLLPLL